MLHIIYILFSDSESLIAALKTDVGPTGSESQGRRL